MNESQRGPIIGIDRGASFTDFGVVESNRLIDSVSLEKRDWNSIGNAYDSLVDQYNTEQINALEAIKTIADSTLDSVKKSIMLERVTKRLNELQSEKKNDEPRPEP